MGSESADPTGGGLAVVVALLVAILSKEYLKRTPLPFTIIMLLFGCLFGFFLGAGECDVSDIASDVQNATIAESICATLLVQHKCEAVSSCMWDPLFYKNDMAVLNILSHSVTVWTTMDPHLVMYTFLPALIYASSSSMNFHIFVKSTRQIFVLAGPGVLIATFLTGALVLFFQPSDYNWTLSSALALGSMLSATDPVAVVALLKEFNAPSNLGIVIEGESLFNDGTAFAIFLICFTALKGETRDFAESILFFLQLAGGGIALGWTLGAIMVQFIGHTQDGMVEVITTLVFAYGSFIIAEQIHVSGVLAVVILGLEMARSGKPLMTDEHMMHHFWHLMEFIANVVIFVICGLQMTNALMQTKDLASDPFQHLAFMALIYIIISIVRIAVIAMLMPLYRWSGYGHRKVRVSEAAVMSWGGIRGAVSLTIAAMVAQTRPALFVCDNVLSDGCTEDAAENETLLETFAGRMLFQCAGVTFLTLVINGTTTGALINYFKLGLQATASQHAFNRVCREVSKDSEKKLRDLKTKHAFFEHMDQELVWDLMPIFNEEMLAERLDAGKINAARFKMIDESPFFRKLREHYEGMNVKVGAEEGKTKSLGGSEGGPGTAGTAATSKVVPFSVDLDADAGATKMGSVRSDEDDFLAITDGESVKDAIVSIVADPLMLEAFMQRHWNEIVEMRRRSLNMLHAIYWHNYEVGLTTESGIRTLLDAVDTAMDRQRRAPREAPLTSGSDDSESETRFTIGSWVTIESSLRPNALRRVFVALCERFGFVEWSRYFLHFTFERTIDLANSYVLAHDKLVKRLEKLREGCEHLLADSELRRKGVHVIHPLVVQYVAEEARRASFSAKKIIEECVGSQNDVLKSIATKHAVRYLLKHIEHAVKHEVEQGNLDETESDMMMTCTLYCQKRLRLGSSIPKPPSIEQFLHRIPFLRCLDTRVIEYIASVSHEKQISKNTVLFQQEMRASSRESSGLYLILGGSVDVFYRDNMFASDADDDIADRSFEEHNTANLSPTARGSDHVDADNNTSPLSSPGAVKERKAKHRWKKLGTRMSAVNMFSAKRKRKSSNEGVEDTEVLGKRIGEFGANEVFGTLAFLTSSSHMMTVKATSMVLYLRIPANVVTKMLSLVQDGDSEGTDARELDRAQSAYREKTSHVAFDKTHDYDIKRDAASEFIEGCCRHAGLQAALTVLEIQIISHFSLRPSEFRNAMTTAIRNASYVRSGHGHDVRLSTPAILLTGALQAEPVGKDEEQSKVSGMISGISFVAPRPGVVYRAAKGESASSTLQMLVFTKDDCEMIRSLSAQKTRRRRYVQQLSRALSAGFGVNPQKNRKKSFFGFA